MKKDLADFIFNDLVDKEKGVVVAPDTTGVDYFFLRYFISDPMEADFPVILQDFMDKCRDRLNEFNEVGWYVKEQNRTIRPLAGMYNRILRLMYNGAKTGDEYCVELIKNLYKVYYTSRNEFQKGQSSDTLVMDIEQVLEGFAGDTTEAGIIINPWSESFLLRKDLITAILKIVQEG